MGLGRMLYSLFGQKISLPVFLTASGILCTGCYLVIALSPNPYLSLVACALCGLGVSMMWPGVYSMAAGRIPRGGSGLFALLAFAGDVGCALSPSLVGPLSGNTDAGLGHAFLVLATFPILFFLCSLILLKKRKVLTLGQFKEEPCREDHPVD
jgi:MFS family permease